LRVVTTTTQATDFARIAAGNGAQVVGILPANVDPRDCEAVSGDLQKIASADLVVENGAGMEDALTVQARAWAMSNRLTSTRRPGTSRWIVVRRGHLFGRDTTIPSNLIKSVTDRVTLSTVRRGRQEARVGVSAGKDRPGVDRGRRARR